MEAVGATQDVFYEEEEEEEEVVNCYDFEPLPTLLEDEVSEAGAGTEPPPPPLRSPVVRRPQRRPAGPLLRCLLLPAPWGQLAGCAGPRRSPEPGGSPAPAGAARPRRHTRSLSVCSARVPRVLLPGGASCRVGLSPSPVHLLHATAKSWSSSVECV